MSARSVEILLARLYSDESLLRQFLASPLATARSHGLSEDEAIAFASVDAADLQLAAHSYARKRAAHGKSRGNR